MPNFANIDIPEGTKVNANSVPINYRNHKFFCTTPGCKAEMVFCNGGTQHDAYFRSKNINAHIGSECIKKTISFDKSAYDESSFDLDFAFASILGLNPGRINACSSYSTKNLQVGQGRHNRVHTLPLLYSLCLSLGKKGLYNGYPIDDILADNENFDRYSGKIEGYKLVETSYYKKVYNELSFLMNYPSNNMNPPFRNHWVKITFHSSLKNFYWDTYKKLKQSSHLEPIIVAGLWTMAPPNAKYQSECVITGKNQLYWAKEQ